MRAGGRGPTQYCRPHYAAGPGSNGTVLSARWSSRILGGNYTTARIYTAAIPAEKPAPIGGLSPIRPPKPRRALRGPQPCAGYGCGRMSTCALAAGCPLEASKAEDAHECYRNDIRPYAPCRRISGLAAPVSTCAPAIQPITNSDYLSEGIWRRGSGCLERHAKGQRTEPPCRAVGTRFGSRDFCFAL